MGMLTRRRTELLSLALLLATVLGLALLFANRHLDRSFITYRYARNLAAGEGIAYNPGQPALSDAVAPLYMAILAAASRLTPDLPRLGNITGSLAMALGMVGLYLSGLRSDKFGAAAAAALYVAFPLLWLALGLDAPLWMALCLLAMWTHLRGWPAGTAALLALATLARPEAGALLVVLVADAVITGRPFNLLPAGIYSGIVAAGLLWINGQVDSGSLLPGLPGTGSALPPTDALAPDVLAGLGMLAQGVFALSPLWVAVLLLAVAGSVRLAIARAETDRWVLLLAGWAGLHLLVLAIARAAVYPWHYAPLIPVLAGLAALGSTWLAGQSAAPGMRQVVAGICVLFAAGAAADSLVRIAVTPPGAQSGWAALSATPVEAANTQAGTWLLGNTPPQARVGATQIGLLGYVAERTLIDYEGRLQPDVAEARARGDGQWWLGEYTPEYLVLHATELESLGDYAPARDPWFNATYTEVLRTGPAGEVVILARAAAPLPLTERFVGMASYPDGIVLNSIATDFSLDPLEEGRAGRVRLEWLLNNPVDAPLVVSISIQGRSGTVAALAGRTVDFSTWPTRRLITTFHTIDLAPGLQPGVYDVAVGIGPDAFALTWRNVAVAKIPFPEAVFVGGVSGSRADFGNLALLGYRLARTPDGLEVLLLWQAVQAPQVDYRVFIQVRDMQGAIAIQQEVQPYGGAYPTSIWSAGEQVPDSYLLDTSPLAPGEYEVFTGLLDPDGNRLLTVDGRDAVRVGRVTVGE